MNQTINHSINHSKKKKSFKEKKIIQKKKNLFQTKKNHSIKEKSINQSINQSKQYIRPSITKNTLNTINECSKYTQIHTKLHNNHTKPHNIHTKPPNIHTKLHNIHTNHTIYTQIQGMYTIHTQYTQGIHTIHTLYKHAKTGMCTNTPKRECVQCALSGHPNLGTLINSSFGTHCKQ